MHTGSSRVALALTSLLAAPWLCRPQAMPEVSPLDGYTAGQVQQGGPAGSLPLGDFETLNTVIERIHRLNPNGIHTKLGGNWNAVWRKWIAEHPNATPSQMFQQARKMLIVFGIGGTDILNDISLWLTPASRIRHCRFVRAHHSLDPRRPGC
jgi:hypothetical protein